MKFSVFQLSRQGGRANNEDRMGYAYTREACLFVLADGMEVAGAELENGLLTIRLTRKRPETRTKTIPIRTAGAKE